MDDFVVNSELTCVVYLDEARKQYLEHGYLTFPAPRIGKDRSLSQNALLHVWLTEYAAHLLRKDKRDISDGELDGMKRISKARFYQETKMPWMVHTVVNPLDPSESKRDYTSSKSWKVGELKYFLDWLQVFAAKDGLVLESIGQHAKLTREQNS